MDKQKRLQRLAELRNPSLAASTIIADKITIAKGEKGDKGDKGDIGPQGLSIRGLDGKDGIDGKDGRNGIDGIDGKDGIDGEKGKDGISPKADDVVSLVAASLKKQKLQDIADPSDLVSFLKRGGFRGGGLSSVAHDTTLTGLGTNASPLSINVITDGLTVTGNGTVASPLVSSGGSGNTAAVTRVVTQAAHGFSVGNVLKLSGSTYILDDDTVADTAGMVTTVTNANTFTLTVYGYVSGLSGLTANTIYYRNPAVPGGLTSVIPVTGGLVVKPLLLAYSATTGNFNSIATIPSRVSSTSTVTSNNIVENPQWVEGYEATTGSHIWGGTNGEHHRIKSTGSSASLLTIGGGYDNEIGDGSSNTIASTIAGGAHHVIRGSHVAIGGGTTHLVYGSYCAVAGGFFNNNYSSYGSMIGGRNNTAGTLGDLNQFDITVAGGNTNVATLIGSTISGGILNTASNTYTTIGGGDTNTASGDRATVAGGKLGKATGDFSSVVGGNNSQANGDYSVAGGNASTVLSTATYGLAFGDNNAANGIGSVALGRRTKATLDGQMVFGNSQFAAVGDAQTSTIVAKCSTTTATPRDLGLSGTSGSGKIALQDNTTIAFSILVVARRTDADNESAAYKFEGCIDRNTGVATTAIVGTVSKTVLAEDTIAWDCNVQADVTNGALQIIATGAAATSIQWVASIRTVETTG